MQRRILVLLLCVVTLMAWASTGLAQATPAPAANLAAALSAAHVPDELLVAFQAGTSPAEMQATHARAGATLKEVLPRLGVHVVKVDPTRLPAALQRYRQDPGVRYAEPNYIAHADFTPNDPGLSQQWGVSKVQAPAGWDINRGSASVVIAVIDTGADPRHPDLTGKSVSGWNLCSTCTGYQTSNTADDNGHGTHVAGMAAASTNNGTGIASIGFNSSFMPIKALDSTGSGSYSDISKGITYAADHGALVENLSLGGSAYSQTLQDAVNYAYNKGLILIAAAGNTGNNTPSYPAACLNVLAIAATDSNDQPATFSSYGSWVALAAPGVNIYSTFWSSASGSTYATLSGTSMATPFVSGLAALLFAQNTTRTNADVTNLMERSADNPGPSGWNQYTGYGRINVYRALAGALTGTVSDALTTAAISGATVQVLQNGTAVGTATTASDGTYTVLGLKAGTYSVSVSASGYVPTSSGVTVAYGQDTVANVSLPRAK